jgi:hypothetical protein
MPEKQKVTLYIPPGLHRQLKIKAAIEEESMSKVVEKAVSFYLQNPEKVDQEEENYGKTHQVHICPECDAAMVIKEGKMVSLRNQPSVIDEEIPKEVKEKVKLEQKSQGEEKLVPC